MTLGPVRADSRGMGLGRNGWVAAGLVLIAGCSADDPGGGGGGGGRENTSAACRNGMDDDRDGLADCAEPDCAEFTFCAGVDGGPPAPRDVPIEECDGFSASADNALAPVDIIWVVDSSDSMENDARTVQTNLDGFADFIAGAGIDFHVVFISDRGFVTPSARFDTDPRFLFVDRAVGSNDAFDRVLDQFPMYMAHLRPSAITHVVGVTDDDEDMSASSFITSMNMLLGHDFTYHVIGSPPGECSSMACPFGCSTCVSGAEGCERPGDFLPAAAPSEEHWRAASMTGGMTFSICTSDWSGLFATLAMTVAVSMALPCEFLLPDPPMGMAFDRDRVNFLYTPSGSTTPMVFPRAADAASCVGNAWYYDNPTMPTRIILCPDACTAVTSGAGTITVQLGCQTLLI